MLTELDFNELERNPASFLSLGIDDPALRKLETYRLYKIGYPVTEIAKKFGYNKNYLYEMWKQFEQEGVRSLVNKNWGSTPRKRTKEVEAAIIRAKAIDPTKSDTDLAETFGIDRSTVYRLLKEHGIQDLHHVVKK